MYGADFYDTITAGSVASAHVVVPLVARMFNLAQHETVLDVGCGRGAWTAQYGNFAGNVIGVDGSWVTDLEPGLFSFVQADLNTEAVPAQKADLVNCLEVGEHLKGSRARQLVAELCDAAPVVIWSAAIPGQVGAGHINEQWPAWWARLFSEHGYRAFDGLRQAIWSDERIEPWYRQNLMVFLHPDQPHPRGLHYVGNWEDLNLVHPVIWGWRMADLGRPIA